MRFLLVLCLATPAFGQINVLSVEKRVEAMAYVVCDNPSLPLSVREHPVLTEGNPLLAAADIDELYGTTPIGAQAEAWQDATFGARNIAVSGGVRNAGRYGPTGSCGQTLFGRSNIDITFALDRPAAIEVVADIIEPPGQSGGMGSDRVILAGDVTYSLTGPDTSIRIDPVHESLVTPDMVPVEAVVRRATDARTFAAGEYVLSLSSWVYDIPQIRSDFVSFRDVSYDVRLDVVHVPEPSTWATLLTMCLACRLRASRLRRRPAAR